MMPAIFGYTLLNDISARDVQFKDNQITIGKNFAGFAPIGPCIVTADALPHPDNVALKTRLNGKTLQDGNTSDWLFSLPRLISFLSQYMPLEPGDIVIDRHAGRRRRLPEAAGLHEGRRRGRDRGRGHRRPQNPDRRGMSRWRREQSGSGSSAAASTRRTICMPGRIWRAKGAVLAAVCDVDPAKAEAAGRSLRRAVLHRRRRHACGRAARRRRHRDPPRHASRALPSWRSRSGIATIVQKPFAPSWEDCVAIVEAADSGRRLARGA